MALSHQRRVLRVITTSGALGIAEGPVDPHRASEGKIGANETVAVPTRSSTRWPGGRLGICGPRMGLDQLT